jgi:hypothetical protein
MLEWNVARVEETRNVHKVLVKNPESKNHFGYLSVNGSVILRWIWNNVYVCELDSISFEHGNEPSVTIKGEECIDQLIAWSRYFPPEVSQKGSC